MTTDVTTGATLNATTCKLLPDRPFPPVLRAVIEAGGLAHCVRRRLGSATL